MNSPVIKLVVTDLDNTLWDWFANWYSHFSVLVQDLSKVLNLSVPELESEIREIHQKYGTTEYSWLLDELPSLQTYLRTNDVRGEIDQIIHRQNKLRKNSISLYPGVLNALKALKERNIPIVAYTEAQLYWTMWRIRQTNLDGVIDTLYSQPDHEHPDFISLDKKRFWNIDDYGLKTTKLETVSRGIQKPNPEILAEIIETSGFSPSQVLYIGDSLSKDISMAQSEGARDAWAKYGLVHEKEEYELLRRVSHWTQEDIEREKNLTGQVLTRANVILHNRFSEIFDHFSFGGRD